VHPTFQEKPEEINVRAASTKRRSTEETRMGVAAVAAAAVAASMASASVASFGQHSRRRSRRKKNVFLSLCRTREMQGMQDP